MAEDPGSCHLQDGFFPEMTSQEEHQKISELAYRIYLSEGQPEGRAEEHWKRAMESLHPRLPSLEEAFAPVSESSSPEHRPQ